MSSTQSFSITGATERQASSYNPVTLDSSSLFPNATAKPIKADLSLTLWRDYYLLVGSTTHGSILYNSVEKCYFTNKKQDEATTTDNGDTGAEIINYSRDNTTIQLQCRSTNSGCTSRSRCSITLYFTRYDFSATAGANVTAASVSSSTGYDGDTITYSCTLASGATFDGWYNGSTRVSTSQTYTHTVNGADLSLQARATGSAEPTKSFSAIYGNSIIISQTQSSNVAVGYNSGTITTLTDNDRIKHLLCKDKLMNTAVTAGGKTLNCGGKVSSYDIPMLYCYGSWELNKGLTTGTATLVDASGWVTTPFIPVSGKINVTVETGGTRSGSMLNEYDSGFGYASYWGASSNPRTFTLDTAASYIRCTFLMSALANCYIYDNTNGKYLFKGGNV